MYQSVNYRYRLALLALDNSFHHKSYHKYESDLEIENRFGSTLPMNVKL